MTENSDRHYNVTSKHMEKIVRKNINRTSSNVNTFPL